MDLISSDFNPEKINSINRHISKFPHSRSVYQQCTIIQLYKFSARRGVPSFTLFFTDSLGFELFAADDAVEKGRFTYS